MGKTKQHQKDWRNPRRFGKDAVVKEYWKTFKKKPKVKIKNDIEETDI